MSDEYPEIEFEITEQRFEANPMALNPVFKKNVRRAMYQQLVEQYGVFIDGIRVKSFYFDIKSMKTLSKRRVEWRKFKAKVLSGWWFDLTYKIRYKGK